MAEHVFSYSDPAPEAAAVAEADLEAKARRWLAEQAVPVYPALRQALGFLGILLVVGVINFSYHKEEFKDLSGKPLLETHPVVDGVYFAVSIFCRIGYGDIVPHSPATKILCCVYALVGVGFLHILLYRALGLVLKDVEKKIFRRVSKWRHLACYVMDARTECLGEKLKIALAFASVALCIGIGSLLICTLEGRDLGNSVYMSIISVTTVGFGDMTFTTFYGRLFGSLWLLVSSIIVLRCFFTMIGARITLEEQKNLKEAMAYFAKIKSTKQLKKGKVFTEDVHLSPPSQGNPVRRNI